MGPHRGAADAQLAGQHGGPRRGAVALGPATLPPPVLDEVRELVVAPGENETLEEIDALDDAPLEEIDFEIDRRDVRVERWKPESVDVSPFDDMSAAAVTVEISDIGLEHAPKSDLLNRVGSIIGQRPGRSGVGQGPPRGVRRRK